jgi:putative addiction module component (TIGR02574 family)
MRIRVKDVLDMLVGGATQKDILADFPDLEGEDIRAFIAHAAQNLDHAVLIAVPVVTFRADTVAETHYFSAMSKAEILAELPKLTPAERQEIRLKLTQIDGEEWLNTKEPLTNSEKALLDARLAAYEKDPEAGRSWEEVEARIRVRLTA